MEMVVDNAKTEPAILEFFNIMDHCFTPFEWKNIRKNPQINSQVQQFFRHWTLKEGRRG